MQSDNSVMFDTGNYSLQFDLPVDSIDEKDTDILKLTYKTGEDTKTISKKVDTLKILQLK